MRIDKVYGVSTFWFQMEELGIDGVAELYIQDL